MNGKHLWTALLSLTLGVFAFGQSASISKERVKEIITTLAADEMDGRKSGTEGARKAARFIAEHYRKAGLVPYQGTDDYLQKFTMHEVEAKTTSLSLDGVAIDENLFAVRAEAAEVSVDDLSQLDVVPIGPEDDPRALMGRDGKSNKRLFLIHSAHAPRVGRFLPWLKRPNTVNALDEDSLGVFVMTDNLEPKSIALKASFKIDSLEMANVVGVLPGKSKPDEYVLFSAHYDHLGQISPVDGDAIANGADDDASGTTAIMELAYYYKALGNHERSVIFAAFTAEEIGGYGSKHMITKINPDSIVAGINIEMIGKNYKESGHGYITGFEYSTLPKIQADAVEGKLVADPNVGAGLFFRSDNATFARRGVPAHSISSGIVGNDPYYHTVKDEVETLDLEHMSAMIETIAKSALSVIDGRQTPSRIDPKSLGGGPL